jgi:hypothetical protein
MNDAIVSQANQIWKFIKDSDGREYYISFYSHWSQIRPVDGLGPAYSVKWLGGAGKHGGSAYISTYGEKFSRLWKDEESTSGE